MTGAFVHAQDVFQKQLFSVDLILKYADDIDLTDQQEASVKRIYNDHITEFNSLKWDLDAQIVKMERLIAASQIDDAEALKKMDDVLSLENKLKKMRFEMMLALKNQLTAVQQEKLEELRSEDDASGLKLITPMNENPRVMLKVDGPESAGQPLYIIKDKQGQHRASSLGELNPQDIEAIEVIKGEKALEQYGGEGKNGVVIITLKSGL